MWRNRGLIIAHDLLWVPVALLAAYWTRFNFGEIPDVFWQSYLSLLLIAVPVQAVSFWFFGLYRGIWRFASLPDLVRILKAVAVGVLATFLIHFIWQRLVDVPRSAIILDPVYLSLGLAVPRMLYRWFRDRRVTLADVQGQRALIVGAGQAAEMLLRDLLKSGQYQPLGLLDDMERKQGQEIHGVRVVGTLADMDKSLRQYAPDIVLLAMPSASHTRIREVFRACQEAGVACRTLPSVAELAGGKVEIAKLRPVAIEDVLGRDVVRIEDAAVRSEYAGKTVLVTGAGGSIGSELVRQLRQYAPARLVMLEQGEFNLYRIDQEMSQLEHAGELLAVLGDVRDEARMRWVFETFHPQIVFHAAAYKHVPLVEANPAEGVKTNILGSRLLADLAVEYKAEKFVLVSTDKAVNPTNVMGATKRAAEIYCQNLNARSEHTRFITTRFGNVLGSAGSVVPLFHEQISRGGPVTVTHPDITRYFMTIPEAVSLILQAGSMGEGGEIYVLDMGEPIRIVDLAEQMIRLSGLEPGVDLQIEFVGLRPGEKLYEELFHASEQLGATAHEKLMLAAARDVNWEAYLDSLQKLEQACRARDLATLRQCLKIMVPEFSEPAAGAD